VNKEIRHVNMQTGEVTEGTVRPFADVLRDLGKGSVADEAAAEVKPPVGDPVAAVFFADDHGNLHRSDPRQEQLALRDIARPDHELWTAE